MLPYQTIEEAASALGRNLTFAETLWFNYSASKSDYLLYCHNIVFLFLIFSVVPVPLVFIELMRIAGFDRYKIQPKVRLSFQEMLRCYKDVMRMFFLIVGPLQLVSYPSVKVRFVFFSICLYGLALDQFGMLSKFLGLVIWVDEASNSCSIGFKNFSSCGLDKFLDFLVYFWDNF